jgi:tRNA(Ile)-lysidine synthase TilS/MesJ
MKCSRCRGPALHRLPAHHAHFCDPCLELFIQRQAEKAIRRFDMLRPGQRVLVAVSGGKDSLALWRILCDLGYETEGLHLALDLGDFSEASLTACRAMAQRLGRPLHIKSLRQMAGYTVEQIVWANRREFCSICGSLKRYYTNQACRELSADTLAFGHHLDDEAGRLLGNMIRRHEQYLASQWPVLEGLKGGFARKVKPLCFLAGEEIKAYAASLDLPATGLKCPRSRGATLTFYQEAMNFLDAKMPGTKRDFYAGFLRQKAGPPPPPQPAGKCQKCGAPTYSEICTACRLLARAAEKYGALSDLAAPASESGPEN